MQTEPKPTTENQPASKLLEVVTRLGEELHPGYSQQLAVTLDSTLDSDLGFDSLSRVELLARIEKSFDLYLPDKILTTAETPRDFLRAVLGADIQADASPLPDSGIKLGQVETVPQHADTLVQVLQWHVTHSPDRPHIRLYSDEDDGEVITYHDLWQSAAQIAASLQNNGLTSGESVLIMLPTGKDYFASFTGILLAGGIPVPVYPPGRIKQIEEHLRRHAAIAANCQAGLMITMPEAKPFARMMHQLVESFRKVVTVAELTAYARPNETPLLQSATPQSTALLQYTSGSTGMPKGVILSHASLLANIRSMGRVLKVTSKDVFISWLPLYHDMGLIGAWLGSLYYACPLVVMPPLSFIARPARWLKAIHRYGGTLSAAPNFAYELCLRRISDKDIQGLNLSSWRCAFNGAEAVSPETIERFIERFSEYGFDSKSIMPVYGLAESSVGLAFPANNRNPVIDRINRQILMDKGRAELSKGSAKNTLRVVGCGTPLPGHQIRIVTDNDRELPDRREGRLQFKGPSSTSGYLKNSAANADLFHDEWLDSGDKAYIANGEVFITGRRKDMIIRAGRNIYPVELEEAIGKIEGINKGNVAVFGSLSTDSATERLIILAETRKRRPDQLSDLQAAINTIINDIAGAPPDDVVLAPPNTVLKTSSGKIRRAASRKLYENNEIGKPLPAIWLQVARFQAATILPRLRRLSTSTTSLFYASHAWLIFGLSAFLAMITIMLLPNENHRWSVIHRILRLAARLAFLPLQVDDLINLPPVEKPCILVSNHASYLDVFILTAALPKPLGFVAKTELKENHFIHFLLKRLGTEFVERFDQLKAKEDAGRLVTSCKNGKSILFFTEGTFMRMPGLLPFRLGAFETAVEANLSVVPIVIRGTRSILREDSWFPRSGKVTVKIGKPIHPDILIKENKESQWQKTITLRNKVRAWILRYCGEPDLEHEQAPIFQKNGQE